MSVVKCSRAAFSATSSGSPGSWIGTSPRLSDSTFAGTMSRAQISWPSSAKQAAVTRPTRLQRPHGAGDGKHLLLVQGEQQGVGDPVEGLGGAPGDQPQAIPVVG